MSIMAASGINFKNAECWQVQPSQVNDAWGGIAPFVQRWVDAGAGEFAADDVRKFAVEGVMQLFIFHAAGAIGLVGITELVQYPQMKVMRIVGIAGENPIVSQKFMPQIEAWAIANGATAMETFATPETVKLDMRLGMKPLYTLMRKPLVGKD